MLEGKNAWMESKVCKRCRAYMKTPEGKAKHLLYIRNYLDKPGVREKRYEAHRNWLRTPEGKKFMDEYTHTPEYKASRRRFAQKYLRKPGVKEKRLAWQRAYYQNPKNRARYNAYMCAYMGARMQNPEHRDKKRAYDRAYQSARRKERVGQNPSVKRPQESGLSRVSL
jgi:hypothetical protein